MLLCTCTVVALISTTVKTSCTLLLWNLQPFVNFSVVIVFPSDGFGIRRELLWTGFVFWTGNKYLKMVQTDVSIILYWVGEKGRLWRSRVAVLIWMKYETLHVCDYLKTCFTCISWGLVIFLEGSFDSSYLMLEISRSTNKPHICRGEKYEFIFIYLFNFLHFENMNN